MPKPLPTKSEFAMLWSDPERSVGSIAREYFVTEHRIMAWAARWGLSKSRDYRRLKFDQRDKIRAMWGTMSIAEISRDLGVGRTTVVRAAANLRLSVRRTQEIAKATPRKSDCDEGPRPGDPLPEEIARLAAECRRRREEVAHAV